MGVFSGCDQCAPFLKGTITIGFEDGSRGEVALEVEVVADRGVCRSEFLEMWKASKSLHGPFSSPEGLM